MTPVLSSAIQTLVVNPDWNVPKNIAFKDILPEWDKDRDYLVKRNLQVLSGWHRPRVRVPEELVDPTQIDGAATEFIPNQRFEVVAAEAGQLAQTAPSSFENVAAATQKTYFNPTRPPNDRGQTVIADPPGTEVQEGFLELDRKDWLNTQVRGGRQG